MPAHILVVDDEPKIAESVADYLNANAGFDVTEAYDGEHARELLVTGGPFDLVVLDRNMPGLTGLELLAWLRKHPTLKYTRVIMFTAASGSREKVDALSAGADDYITKPHHPQELLARVQTILRSQRLEKQLQRQGEQLAALNRISNTITTTLDPAQIPGAAATGIQAVLGVETGAVFTRDQETRQLHCRAAVGASGPLPADAFTPLPFGDGITGLAFSEQTPLSSEDLAADSRFRPGQDAPHGADVCNLLVSPLLIRGQPVGVLSALNKRDGEFTEVDRDLFSSLANAVSRALENASLFQKVRTRQQELQQSHDRLQAVINGILHPIYTIDKSWRLAAVNQFQIDALAARPDQAVRDAYVGEVCYSAFFDRDTPCDHCQVAQVWSQQTPQQWSVREIGEDHLPQEWDVHAYPLPATQRENPSAVVVWQDRTEEKRLEQSLLQAGKLAAIGQLAAGVAHEINNPLTVINANAHMLKLQLPADNADDEDLQEAVDLIGRAGDRAANVVRGLLDYARQNRYQFDAGGVNQSIHQALRLVDYQLRSAQIEVVETLADDLPKITASWDHIKTVWINLLINARDALLERPDGRRIAIETRLAADGDRVLVLINDNGGGMTPAESAHIFEPFYTTKDPGQGTGLGLATSQRIVQQHGGSIEAVPDVAEGATFIVRLPFTQDLAGPGAS